MSELCDFADAKGPLTPGQIRGAAQTDAAACGRHAVRFNGVNGFLEDLGMAVVDMLGNAPLADRGELARVFARLFAAAVGGVSRIAPQRNNEGVCGREFPPALPNELSRTRGRDFATLMREQRARLRATLSEAEVDKICGERVELVEAVDRERSLKLQLQALPAGVSFDDRWKTLNQRFPSLRSFAGGLATIFPGTSVAESDFSLAKWERDECRQQMRTLSLAGVLHAKQFAKVQSIST